MNIFWLILGIAIGFFVELVIQVLSMWALPRKWTIKIDQHREKMDKEVKELQRRPR